jgi:hypothetical protein
MRKLEIDTSSSVPADALLGTGAAMIGGERCPAQVEDVDGGAHTMWSRTAPNPLATRAPDRRGDSSRPARCRRS